MSLNISDCPLIVSIVVLRSPFLYLALLGALEVPGTLLVTPLGGRLGRRAVGCGCAVIMSALLAVMAGLKGTAHPGEITVTDYLAHIFIDQCHITRLELFYS